MAKTLNYPMTFCKGIEWKVTIHLCTLPALRGRFWQACQPSRSQLEALCFLGRRRHVPAPDQCQLVYEDILRLPPSERCKHLGAMVVLLAAMTEHNNRQDDFSASAFVADIVNPLLNSGDTDTLPIDDAPSLQDF